MQQKLLTRSVQQMGPGSLGATFPKELTDLYEVEVSDEIPYDYDVEAGTLTFHLDSGEADR